MAIDAPLQLYQNTIQSDWIDYNGHLNDGFYAVVFSYASEGLLDYLDLHHDYLARTQCTMYTAEAHICYLRELKEAAPIRVSHQLLGFDSKRIHLYQEMIHQDDGFIAATQELMFLHVNQQHSKVTSMPDEKQSLLAHILDAHKSLGRPTRVGRTMAVKS